MRRLFRWPLMWRKNHKILIEKLQNDIIKAQNSHEGFIVEDPTNGSILCFCQDSANKAKKGAQAISNYPNSVYIRSATLKRTDGRWHR